MSEWSFLAIIAMTKVIRSIRPALDLELVPSTFVQVQATDMSLGGAEVAYTVEPPIMHTVKMHYLLRLYANLHNARLS